MSRLDRIKATIPIVQMISLEAADFNWMTQAIEALAGVLRLSWRDDPETHRKEVIDGNGKRLFLSENTGLAAACEADIFIHNQHQAALALLEE